MVQLQAAHVRLSMHSAGPPPPLASCGGDGAAANSRCCSNQQLAAAWAWFERSGAGSPSSDAAPRRADILNDAARRQKVALRPSRFKEEFLASIHHQLHDFQSTALPPWLRRWRRSFSTADLASPAAADRPPGGDDSHRAGTELSRLLDEFEIESLCRQLWHHIKSIGVHPALHSAPKQPISKYDAADEEDAMVSAPFSAVRSSIPGLFSPDMRISSSRMQLGGGLGGGLMRKSHSKSDSGSKPRRHLPLLCSSTGGTIDSLRAHSHGSSIKLIRNNSTKSKHHITLYSDSIAKAGAAIGAQNASADELDPPHLHKHRHVHHHHHHHHHHVLHHTADDSLLRLKGTLAVDRDGIKESKTLLLSPKANLENQRIHVQLQEILARQCSSYKVNEGNKKLLDSSPYFYEDKKNWRDHERFNSITNAHVSQLMME